MSKYQNLNLAQVQTLASELALALRNKSATIGLIGPLGSGKTTFVQAFSNKLGINAIKSPTFVIAHRYRIGKKFLHHFDFYRLEKPKQLEPLGLEEILSGKNLVLIEWVDRFPKIKKFCDIIVKFKVKQGNLRDVQIQNQK